MKGIALCAECADYDKRKHCCKRGASREDDPRNPFYDDCPLPEVVRVPEREPGGGQIERWLSKYGVPDNLIVFLENEFAYYEESNKENGTMRETIKNQAEAIDLMERQLKLLQKTLELVEGRMEGKA